MSKPVPVSINPDELVFRRYVVNKRLPGYFDKPGIAPGTQVWVRCSPFLNAARSYWLENEGGELLTIVGEETLRRDCTPMTGLVERPPVRRPGRWDWIGK